MKRCPRCSRDNDDAVANCMHCGVELGNSEKTPTAAGQKFAKSGEESFSKRVKSYYWFSAWAGVALIVLAINPAYLRASLLFPVGLFALLPIGDGTGIGASMMAMEGGIFIVGWALYAVLTAMMFNAKNRRVFFARYIIFCVLLLLNISGCHHILKSLSGIQ
jgi:hypothetical protein